MSGSPTETIAPPRPPAGRPTHVPEGRRPGGMAGAAVLLLGLAGTWLWLSMLSGPWHLMGGLTRAQDDLSNAKSAISSGALKAARYYTYDAAASVREARSGYRGGGPLFDLARVLPTLGPALDEVPHILDAAGYSSQAAKGTLHIAQTALKGRNKIIAEDPNDPGGSVIRLDRVTAVGDEIGTIRDYIVKARSALQAVAVERLPHTVRHSVKSGISEASRTAALLAKAHAGFGLLPAILGGEGKRTYILAFQNSAEERGTGGAMLQFAVMDLVDGAPHMEKKVSTVYKIDQNRRPLSIPLPEDAWYVRAIADAQRFGNSNWSPDWPLSTRLMIAYGQASTAPFPAHVDGMIGVDPVAAQEMMKGIGPFRTPESHIRISGHNLVNFLLFKAYASYPVAAIRRIVLHDVVKAFYAGMFDPAHPSDLVKGMGKALGQKHVQIWMADPAEEAFIKRMHWDGAIRPAAKGDYSAIVEQNVGGNKLDYFEVRDYSLDVRFDGKKAIDTSRARIYNSVVLPQPRWSMGDSGPFHHPMLNFYAPGSAELRAAHGPELDPVPPADPRSETARLDNPAGLVWASGDPPEHSERAKKVWSGTLDIPPGREAAMTMTYSVPEAVQTKGGRSTYKLVLQHQPGVHPPHMTVTIHLPRGARKVSAPGFERRADTLVWDRPMNKDLVLRVSWSAAT